MKSTNLRNMLLCSALVGFLLTTVSCKNEGNNEQGVEAASDANATNSGTTPDDNMGTDGDANAGAGETNSTQSDSVTTTTNGGNSTANGSGMK
ncbi:hypothetical protein AAEO56_12005 [Flavobacterium sp. DGU11]|uniref:Uncharacterized protein n=1 Tax=Flavobacterium arundinis TaxID=3139143 RepID=A0ABU9HYD8_9FLAO